MPKGNLEISGRFLFEDAERDLRGRHRFLATGETTVEISDNTEVTLTLAPQPACRDGINNDPEQDDTADSGDSGCTGGFASRDPSSADFEYEPKDDNEVLVRRSVSQTGARDETYFISNKAGNRVTGAGGANFHPSFANAVGQIDMFIKNKPETDIGFAVEVYCVPEGKEPFDDNRSGISEIISGDASAEGFRDSPVNGINRSFVSNGTRCGFKVVHASKVWGEDPADGGEIIRFASETENPGNTVIWFSEEELKD